MMAADGDDSVITTFLLAVVPFHRASLIVATVGLAIAGSRVASHPAELPAWVVMVGAAVILVVADLSKNIYERAKALAGSATASVHDALRDIYGAEGPTAARWLLLAGIALILVGIALYALGVGVSGTARCWARTASGRLSAAQCR